MGKHDDKWEEYPYPGFGWQVAKCAFLFYGVVIVSFVILLLTGAFE